MRCLRKPTADEMRLLKVLVREAKGLMLPAGWQASLLVEAMDDGGMGSLKLAQSDDLLHRKFGKAVSTVEFDDADGVRVSVALNVDQDGRLFEMDIWKTDFSRLIRIPKFRA